MPLEGIIDRVTTTGVVPAAGDEVSASIAALFSEYGRDLQRVGEGCY